MRTVAGWSPLASARAPAWRSRSLGRVRLAVGEACSRAVRVAIRLLPGEPIRIEPQDDSGAVRRSRSATWLRVTRSTEASPLDLGALYRFLHVRASE
ncbi:ATP-binding protein [Nonomuraea dietziae]|uniref:ATP-binding protein n=1 Tax=Nonomuraea dietziae TaxID=65515 RepID=UPI0031CEB5EF